MLQSWCFHITFYIIFYNSIIINERSFFIFHNICDFNYDKILLDIFYFLKTHLDNL